MEIRPELAYTGISIELTWRHQVKSNSGLFNITFMVGVVLIFISSIWLIKTIRYQSALSKMYITKNHCDYNPEKSLVIFLDARSNAAIKRFRVTINGILKEANKTFAEAGIKIRYNIKNLKLRNWNTESSECKFHDASFMDEKRCFVKEMSPRTESVRKIYDPDILIFMTADGIGDISGKSYWKTEQGNGTIVLNLGIASNDYGSSEKLKTVAKKFFQRKLGQLLIHEHAHLYGVPHSSDQFSIMEGGLDKLGSHRVKLDKKSVQILMERNEQLKKSKQSCAARE